MVNYKCAHMKAGRADNPRHHPPRFFLIISGEKYPWNCIFMAQFEYQEADPAPSKVKVCISISWIRGLKHPFYFGDICFPSVFRFPKIKLGWVGIEHRIRLN